MTSVRVVECSADEHELLDTVAWRDAICEALVRGERLVTMFGRPSPTGAAVVTAVTQLPSGSLAVVRGLISEGTSLHAVSHEFPAAHCFEREMHEQLRVRIHEHPWLKPVRFEGANLGRMADYPFYELKGKEVHEVAVGPVHAGVIEPGSFRFMCLGERVHHLEIQLGYQHRGVEALLLRGDLRARTPLVETIAGDTSVAHAWAYCAAVESLAETDADLATDVSRGVALELERIAMHLSGLAGMAQDIGFAQGASTYGRLRTTAINTTQRLCGSRFGRTWLRPGGSQGSMPESVAVDVRANLAMLRHDLAIINERFLSSTTVQHRLRGTGMVSEVSAIELGLVGPVARASGVRGDQRDGRHGIYAKYPVPSPTLTRAQTVGDCLARAIIRIAEIDASLTWLGQVLDDFRTLTPHREPLGTLRPNALVVALCEGWRGEVVHAVETDMAGRALHYKVQDPSLRNWFGLAMAMRDGDISDFPICNKSFDLSYSGNDL